MKHGTMVFFGIVTSFVALSYVALPLFLVVFQAFIAGWLLLGVWFMLFQWWVLPLFSSSWAPSTEVTDLRVTAPTENSAIGCAKVLAGREMDRLSYAFSDDDEYDEVQASLRARR
jgi:energy-coupling factor transporter transmembrane protein EcfT